MAEPITIQKNSVQETLVIPLYARKLGAELFPSLYQDSASAALMERLNYDFTELDKKMKTTMGRFGALETAMRQKDLAIEVKAYLQAHPQAAVVNMGCGLDQTGESCDNGSCRIYNLDFPDVIAVRNELIPPAARVQNLAVNLNDPAWFDAIDAAGGVIFFGAGLFYYFRQEEVKKLFTAMAGHFPGGVLVFDAAGRTAVRMMIKTWVKQAGIADVDAYFYVNDIRSELAPWLTCREICARGYMLGYHSLKDPSVSHFFRSLAWIADHWMKMKIVKIEF